MNAGKQEYLRSVMCELAGVLDHGDPLVATLNPNTNNFCWCFSRLNLHVRGSSYSRASSLAELMQVSSGLKERASGYHNHPARFGTTKISLKEK